jgi:hypothetical protein
MYTYSIKVIKLIIYSQATCLYVYEKKLHERERESSEIVIKFTKVKQGPVLEAPKTCVNKT